MLSEWVVLCIHVTVEELSALEVMDNGRGAGGDGMGSKAIP